MTAKRFEITAMAYSAKGRLIAVGKNSYVKTHPLQARFGKESGKDKAIFLHAEVAALVKAKEPVHRLVVMRFNAKGEPVLAKPCKACELAIEHFRVKFVEHT